MIVSVETMPVPRVSDDQRITVDDLGNPADGIFFVGIRYGYMERPDVPAALALVDPALTEGAIDLGNATYFCPRSTWSSVRPRRWRRGVNGCSLPSPT